MASRHGRPDPSTEVHEPYTSFMIRLTEVGPRDGLQNETSIIPTEDKVRFEVLLRSGALNRRK